MKKPVMRHILEAELLKYGKIEKPLKQSEFDRYYSCLLTLSELDRLSVFEQKSIYTATFGNIADFAFDFIKHIRHTIERQKNGTTIDSVLLSSTEILFSPRLTEIALGCMLSIFLKESERVEISFFSTRAYVMIRARGKFIGTPSSALPCIKKIAQLHSGRIIHSICRNHNDLTLALPIFSPLTPISLVPCSPELCRLCRT